MISKWILWLVILVEGFVTISAEVLTIRQLLPMVGNSVIVTSLIIGVFLLFLAYGYRRGGQYQKNYNDILKRNFTKGAILLGIGLSYGIIDLFFASFYRYFTKEVLIVLATYLILVTAPLVYILGQTVPITMNLLKHEKTTGAIGGKILHLSTIGSFLGAVLTSLLLMNYLGVGWTVLINYGLLMLLALVLCKDKQKDFVRGVVLCGGFLFVYVLNVALENQLFVKTNAYTNYKMAKSGNNKILVLNGSLSSMLTPSRTGFAYIEFIKRIVFNDLGLRGKRILVLGAGGFTVSAAGTQGNHFVYVDVDKDMKAVVEKHLLDSVQGEFIVSDARAFLNSNQKKFDVIISDVYSNKRAIPAHLLTQEYFLQIQKNLMPKGIAILNIIAHPTLDDPYSEAMDNTIRAVFNQCMAIPENYTNGPSNIVYICRNKAEKSISRLQFYRDNLNKATEDFFRSISN